MGAYIRKTPLRLSHFKSAYLTWHRLEFVLNTLNSSKDLEKNCKENKHKLMPIKGEKNRKKDLGRQLYYKE